MQTREKWQRPSPDIEPGSVVMLVDPQVPRSLWHIGRVMKVFPGADGHVRIAEIQIKGRTYTRPIARLIVLPEIPEEDQHPGSEDNQQKA